MLRLLLLMTAVSLLASCVDRSEVPVPAYLHISNIGMKTTASQGSASQSLRDAWIYVNDTFAGAYEMPCTVPVNHWGDAEIKVYAGIRDNGMVTHPVRYVMLSPYVQRILLRSAVIDTLSPSVTYSTGNAFIFNETFDGSHFFRTDRDGDPQTQVSLSSSQDAFEGRNSGEIFLTAANPLMIAEYDLARSIPVTPNKVYIELNYKSDVQFYVGFYGYTSGLSPQDYVFGSIKPRTTWGKIYFDFTPYVNECACEQYRLAIIASYDTAATAPQQHILLDNFKLIRQ